MSENLTTDVVPMVTVTIDGVIIEVPKGTLAIRAAELIGIEIPRFCDHPLLEPVAACRACLIEVEGMPKPQPACAQVVNDGMTIRTQESSEVAKDAQEGVMEFLLINHPLDCPVCDKGGECPLQNQSMSAGRPESRFEGEKRTFEKPINVSAQILLDRERCVSCARCTRFADQIAGDPMLELLERGANQQVGVADDQPFESYFSGNTIQICPVGALTSAAYRFRSRPFDLVSVPTTCEHCASGCSLRTDYRRGEVTRRLAWDSPEVNEEWNCDKGRFGFTYLTEGRISTPLVRENGELRPASWPEAIDVAARGLAAAGSSTGVLTGGRLTQEDAYGYAKFARAILGTDNIDFRARATSSEEAQYLRSAIAGTPVTVTYDALEKAPFVLLVAFEPEDESPMVFLRLRKAKTSVVSLGAVATRGLKKMGGTLLPTKPGQEALALRDLPADVKAAL
ncbi:MAG: NADH-quinone oxidoreductase subunit G, partial [Actinobacteria bacterium]|nr:NADH-quinone oxidoreductase subunit G [Actinomycetota bacterium]